MKIGEVRVAEDSDFALLKVSFNITIVETNIFSVVLNFIMFFITVIMIHQISQRESDTIGK